MRAWATTFIILIFAILAFINRISISLMVDPIKNSFRIDDFGMGLLQGPAFALFFLLGSLPMGWIVDRYSKRWTIYLGVTVWSLATIASAFANSFFALVIARCIVGLGEATLQPAGWSMVAKIFPARRFGLAISILSSGAQIGAAFSYILGGLILAESVRIGSFASSFVGLLTPWQIVFLVSGIPGIFLAFLIFIAPKERKGNRKDTGENSLGLKSFIHEERKFLTYHFLGFGFQCAMVLGAAAWIPTYLQRIEEISVTTTGVILAILAFPIGTFGVIFAGWFADRAYAQGRHDIHLSHFSNVCAVMVLIGGLTFSFSKSAPLTIAALAFMGLIQPFSGVAGASLQISTPSAVRGRISAAFIMFYNAVGMTLGPSFIAFISDYVVGPERLGIAIAINFAVMGSLASLFLWLGKSHAAAASRKYGALIPDQNG
ncbi:MFS transporter [Leptospira koniambonensis]|uniref:MFS transporter n=1 Tax=Leptospira koniambonensis TaxID=2484950 RepID=UPI003EBCA953